MESSISEKTKGILTVLGGVCLHLVLGACYSFGLLSPYLLSYLKQYNDNILKDDGLFLLPLAIAAQCITMSYGGYLEKKKGPRFPMIIGGILIIAGYVLFYFSKILFINYICSFVVGLGSGLAYLAPVRTAWHYFPEQKGLAVGFIVGGYGLSSAILVWIIKAIINPDNIKGSNGFYPESVYSNVPSYNLFLIITFTVLIVISILLTQPYNEDFNLPKEPVNVADDLIRADNFFEDDEEDNYKEEKGRGSNDSSGINDIEIENSNNTKIKIRTVKLRKAIFSKKNFLFFLIGLLNYYFPVTVINTLKTFTQNYELYSSKDDYVFWLSFALYLGNGIFRTIWGYLFDKLGFKKLCYIIFILVALLGFSFYYIIENEVLIFIYCLIISAFAGAPFTLLPAGINQVFGTKYASEVYGSTFYCFGAAAILTPVLSKSLSLGTATSTTPFMILYFVGGGMGVVGFLVSLLLDMNEYKYQYY